MQFFRVRVRVRGGGRSSRRGLSLGGRLRRMRQPLDRGGGVGMRVQGSLLWVLVQRIFRFQDYGCKDFRVRDFIGENFQLKTLWQ
jgi:hypothetical protein